MIKKAIKTPIIAANGLIIKPADKMEEIEKFYNCRFENYVKNGYLKSEDLTKEQMKKRQEYDEYDGIESTNYLVLKDGEQVVGGVRIIRGDKMPIKTGILLPSKRPMDFGKYIPSVEVSRLIIEDKYRNPRTLSGILKMIAISTSQDKILACTSQKPQIPLYQSIGFETIKNKLGFPLEIKYTLHGEWYPLIGKKEKAQKNPDKIEGFSNKLFKKILEPIDGISNEEVVNYIKENNPYKKK